MRFAFRILLPLFLLVSSASAMIPTEARAWQEDLRFMTKEMQSTHKNLYHSISAEDFATMVRNLNAEIPSLTRAEVIVKMAQIVAAVGDGHRTFIRRVTQRLASIRYLSSSLSSVTNFTFPQPNRSSDLFSGQRYFASAV
jgi:hypothetical protein